MGATSLLLLEGCMHVCLSGMHLLWSPCVSMSLLLVTRCVGTMRFAGARAEVPENMTLKIACGMQHTYTARVLCICINAYRERRTRLARSNRAI